MWALCRAGPEVWWNSKTFSLQNVITIFLINQSLIGKLPNDSRDHHSHMGAFELNIDCLEKKCGPMYAFVPSLNTLQASKVLKKGPMSANSRPGETYPYIFRIGVTL